MKILGIPDIPDVVENGMMIVGPMQDHCAGGQPASAKMKEELRHAQGDHEPGR